VCVDTTYGRGLEAIKRFEIGDLMPEYDGHRVDEQGNVVIRRAHITELMNLYPEIDREAKLSPFQKTHAIRLGRKSSKSQVESWGSRESGLLVCVFLYN
jgi:hypothetical protein